MKTELIIAEAERQLEKWRSGAGAKPTVSSLAAACGISRQAIYRTHASAVHVIRSCVDRNSSRELKGKLLRERLSREVEKVAVLTTLCGELSVRLHDALEELAVERSKVERMRLKAGIK